MSEIKSEKFDVETLTLGEVATIEDLAGFAIDRLKDPDTPKGNLLAAIAYVVKKRNNPKYTFPMALTLSMKEVTDLIGDDDDTDEATDAPKGS